MIKRRILSCLFTCLLILYTLPSNSNELKKEAFSIMIPEDWLEMPRKAINDYLKNLAALAPDVPVQSYDYGFQSKFTDDWFEYPYILIQINNKGRISALELEKLEDIPVQKSIDAHKKKLNTILSDVELQKMVYDKNAGIVWMRIELDVVKSGPVSGLVGMIPTEKGFINVIGYSNREEYPDYEPIFQTIAMTVAPAPDLVYQTRMWEKLWLFVSHMDRQDKNASMITGGLALFIVLFAVFVRIKRLKWH